MPYTMHAVFSLIERKCFVIILQSQPVLITKITLRMLLRSNHSLILLTFFEYSVKTEVLGSSHDILLDVSKRQDNNLYTCSFLHFYIPIYIHVYTTYM